MQFQMSFKISQRIEGYLTLGTDERLLSGVHSHMKLKIGGEGKSFSALVAGKWFV
jgi:hypothetical protein